MNTWDAIQCIKNTLLTIETEINSINTEFLLLTQNEDAQHTTGDLGIMALGVRNDAGGSLVSANGDYASYTTDGNGAIYTGDIQYKQRLAYNGSNVEYVGEALPGSAENVAVWRIKKLTYNGSNVTAIDWADGVATFSKTWTGYAGYTYS